MTHISIIATPVHIALAKAAGARAGREAAEHAMSDAATRDALCRHLAEHDAVPDDHVPDLSGQWADDPTPLTLACSILGLDRQIVADHGEDAMDALASAWEEAAAEAYEAHVRELARERAHR